MRRKEPIPIHCGHTILACTAYVGVGDSPFVVHETMHPHETGWVVTHRICGLRVGLCPDRESAIALAEDLDDAIGECRSRVVESWETDNPSCCQEVKEKAGQIKGRYISA